MIEIALLLMLIGGMGASEKREGKEDTDTGTLQDFNPGGARNFQVDTSHLLDYQKFLEKPAKKFEYFASGYDSTREVWWIRKDKWEIKS